jgi:hypothetical protein
MSRVTQEGRPVRHRGQDAALTFDTPVLFDPGKFSHPAHQGFRLMRVQLVTH